MKELETNNNKMEFNNLQKAILKKIIQKEIDLIIVEVDNSKSEVLRGYVGMLFEEFADIQSKIK